MPAPPLTSWVTVDQASSSFLTCNLNYHDNQENGLEWQLVNKQAVIISPTCKLRQRSELAL